MANSTHSPRVTAQHCECEGIKFDSLTEAFIYRQIRASIPFPLKIIREPKVFLGTKKTWKVDFQVGDKLLEVKGFVDRGFYQKLDLFKRWNGNTSHFYLICLVKQKLPDWVQVVTVEQFIDLF